MTEKKEISNQIRSIIIDGFEQFCKLSPEKNSSSEKKTDYFKYFSGTHSPYFNGIWWYKFPFEQSKKELIDQSNSYFDKSSYVWWIDPTTQRELSNNSTFTKEFNTSGAFVAMGMSLKDYKNEKVILAPDLNIEKINEDKTLEIWFEIFCPIFNLDEKDFSIFRHVLGDYGPSQPYEHFLAKHKNKPIGVISLLTLNNISYMCNMAVLEEFRRKSIGTSLGKICIDYAIKHNSHVVAVLLMASKQAKSLCETLGLMEYFHIYPYTHIKNH